MDALVTGVAGFIGFHLTRRMLMEGGTVVGIDNLNDYYDVRLKETRLAILRQFERFSFERADLADRQAMERVFDMAKKTMVIHLAGQAGVRYSKLNPHAYVDSNVVGFLNVLECCRQRGVQHLVYASSSSVYGANRTVPFSSGQNVDHPLSLYAATKKANELMAHSYSHLYRLPTTGLRFFSVYGPWGRPDMAYFSFTKAILAGQPIELFNEGRMKRDFTYVDDIVEGLLKVAKAPPKADPAWDPLKPSAASSNAPYRLYNIGNSRTIELLVFVSVLEDCLGKKAVKRLVAAQSEDVIDTLADVSDLERDFNWKPTTALADGLNHFVHWYRSYHGQSVGAVRLGT